MTEQPVPAPDHAAAGEDEVLLGSPLTRRARTAAIAATSAVAAVVVGGLVALAASNGSTPASRRASTVPAIPGKGPLDAGMSMVQGLTVPVGHPATFRLALDNTGSRPVTVVDVVPLRLDPGVRVASIRGLDPRHAGRTLPIRGYAIPPQGRLPSDVLAGLEITLTRDRPGSGALQGVAVSYRVGAGRPATSAGDTHTISVVDSWAVCTAPVSGRRGCAPVSLGRLLDERLPGAPDAP